MSEKRNGDEFWRLMARYLPILGLMPGSILAGYLIGAGLDHVFLTTYLKLVFIVLGVAAGLVQTLRILSRDDGK